MGEGGAESLRAGAPRAVGMLRGLALLWAAALRLAGMDAGVPTAGTSRALSCLCRDLVGAGPGLQFARGLAAALGGCDPPPCTPLPARLSPDTPTAHPAALGPWWGQPLHLPDRIIPGLVLQLGKLSAALN